MATIVSLGWRMENAQSPSRGLSLRCPFLDLMALPGLDEGCDKLGCRINLELLRFRRTGCSQGTICFLISLAASLMQCRSTISNSSPFGIWKKILVSSWVKMNIYSLSFAFRDPKKTSTHQSIKGDCFIHY